MNTDSTVAMDIDEDLGSGINKYNKGRRYKMSSSNSSRLVSIARTKGLETYTERMEKNNLYSNNDNEFREPINSSQLSYTLKANQSNQVSKVAGYSSSTK